MNTKIDSTSATPTLVVSDSVRGKDSTEFIAQLNLLAGKEGDSIVLNLKRVTFLDSSAIGGLCAVHMQLQKNGRNLRVLTSTKHSNFVPELFEDAGLNELLIIECD